MVILLMGVSGSGKSTVGRLLSQELGWTFYEGDDFHPSANVEKMRSGIPLDDDDRRPWLQTLRDMIQDCLERGESAVLACSALKESYREFLLIDEKVILIYLKADYVVIRQRLSQRHSHYMNPSLLNSQFATLDEPEADTHVEAAASPDEIVQTIMSRLGLYRP